MDDTVAGVPGAESNLPRGLGEGRLRRGPPRGFCIGRRGTGAAPARPAGALRESHTRNYEIDHVTEKRTHRERRPFAA